MEDVFVLLDDCNANGNHPASRLYTGFVRQHVCVDPGQLDAIWQRVDADIAAGLHAAVFIDYEWGARLLKAGHAKLRADQGAMRVLLFNTLARLDAPQVEEWLAARDGSAKPTPAGVMDVQADVSRPEFEDAVTRIQELIRAGETYQVNYTYRMTGRQFGSPVGLYRRLRALQPVSFGCLAALPALSTGGESQWILSCSPELFVRNVGGHLTTRPMKGTAPREAEPKADDGRGLWLSQDPKNLAENVMIVDLLRNDLGRISEIGSVKVPKLFAVETYRTVYQMTSTIESRILPGLGFPDVLRALFPCGSITGTPKVHTMDLIAGLEKSPRGIYCGAIGWIDAAASPGKLGDFCLSVAIRTLQLGTSTNDMRTMSMGVGGGVVIDSTPASEFEETGVKARFLMQLDPGFTLFETMLLRNGSRRNGSLRNLALHMMRLQRSASALGFQYDEARIRQALQTYVQSLPNDVTHRVRLDLRHDGTVDIKSAVLEPLVSGPVKLVMANSMVPASERALLAHKTSLRNAYDTAIRNATTRGAFDAIFVNAQGFITEGGRSSLFVKLQGRWYTPALPGGVLPGVMRSRVLGLSKAITERDIRVEELAQAQGLAVCNALRGVVRAELMPG